MKHLERFRRWRQQNTYTDHSQGFMIPHGERACFNLRRKNNILHIETFEFCAIASFVTYTSGVFDVRKRTQLGVFSL